MEYGNKLLAESGSATANVNNGAIEGNSRILNPLEREGGMFLVPTNFGFLFGFINLLPMLAHIYLNCH